VQPNQPLDCGKDLCSAVQVELRAASASVTPPSWSITSVTAEAKSLKGREGPPVDDATRVVAQTTSSHRADMGMAWGTLIHGLLEHAMRHQNATREDLRRLAMWLSVEEPQLRPVVDQALDAVERLSVAPFWTAARQQAHCVETPFAVAGPGGQLTNGVIDLLFENAAGWNIVDYKTDQLLDRGKYDLQLAAYRNALAALGCQVADASLVNVRTGAE
jgi:ATP-dependent exoDNAse (exonuclease V) beta subunit